MCDLGLRLDGTWLEEPIERVREELADRDLRIKPHFWLADEWFSPDGIPGVGVPFYLAHERLAKLEREMMFEVEGGSRPGCLKLLRHEVGHAVQHAYDLHKRRRWQNVFGKASEKYPDVYRPNPNSRAYVLHLDGWYAQSHPAEDFAETFAVWLKPRSRWRARYEGWPALEKLEYVDELMDELSGVKPKKQSRARPYSLGSLRHTLRTHYDRKRDHYSGGFSQSYDRELLRLFSNDPKYRNNPTAASFVRRHRAEVRELVAEWTGTYQFTIDQVIKEMIGRCKELKLRLADSERRTKTNFTIVLAVHTVHHLDKRGEWHSL